MIIKNRLNGESKSSRSAGQGEPRAKNRYGRGLHLACDYAIRGKHSGQFPCQSYKHILTASYFANAMSIPSTNPNAASIGRGHVGWGGYNMEIYIKRSDLT